ncbi:ligninase lg6 precursor [Phlyctema vagabunda]|uniref:Peroxidase n=1 Tax=Phlyctema vagabunda TaxID=108571 RepID=A0ABR4P3V7_9HELO
MRYIRFLLAASALREVKGFSVTEVRNAISEYSFRSLNTLRPALPLEEKKDALCPAVWTTIVSELTALFIDKSVSPSQCNGNARAAIREAFHDCGTWDRSQGSTGGCDGSVILAREAYTRPINNGLQDISDKLLALQKRYPSVSVADIIQVASSVAVVTCPGGPRVTTYVGRKDSNVPNPDGLLPDVHASGASLFALFQDKGFDARDLAALLGAHSTSKSVSLAPEIPVGGQQDSTPGIWDVKYYSETLKPQAGVFPFQSDVNLAKHPEVGKEFSGFVNNQGKWTGKFADAMFRMSLLGVPGGTSNLIDCTNVIPKGTSSKRDIKAAPINDRAR